MYGYLQTSFIPTFLCITHQKHPLSLTALFNMSEKHADVIEPTPDNRSDSSGPVKPDEDDFEIFRKQEGVVDFRTVSWQHTSMIFLK